MKKIEADKLGLTGDRVLLRKQIVKDEGFQKSKSGLYVAKDTESVPNNYSEIVAVGPDIRDSRIAAGTWAVHMPYGGNGFVDDGQEYLVMSENEILGVTEE